MFVFQLSIAGRSEDVLLGYDTVYGFISTCNSHVIHQGGWDILTRSRSRFRKLVSIANVFITDKDN